MDRITSSRASRKGRPPTADVHDYFTTIPIENECRKKFVRCTALYSINSGKSTLRPHARKYGFLLETKTQKRFTPEGELRPTVEMPKTQYEERVTSQICRWIVNSSLPFLCVEDKGFMKLISIFESDFKVPSRFTVSRRIKDMHI